MYKLNKDVITNILNDKAFEAEVKELLNALIDAELQKNDDEIDFDFIDECSEILVDLANESKEAEGKIIKLFSSGAITEKTNKITLRGLSTSMKIAIIAAVFMLSTFTVNAAVTEFTGKSIIENIAAITQTEEETTKKETTTRESTTAPKTTKHIPSPTDKDDSVVVTEPEETTDGSEETTDKYVYVINDALYGGDFRKGNHTKYVSKGNALDHLKYKYVNGDVPLAQDFDEKQYMSDYYPDDICYENNEKKHTFTEWKTTKKPTCGELGEKKRHCTVCGWEQVCPIKATGKHSWEYKTLYGAPSDKKDTLVAAICKKCDVEAQTNIPYAKTLVLESDKVYYNGNSNFKLKVLAVLDRNGYEIPKKYWKVEYQPDLLCGKSSWVGANMSGIYGGSVNAHFDLYPAKVALKSIVVDENSFTVFWNRSRLFDEDHATGFEIEYSKSSDFSESKKQKIKNYKASSGYVSGLSHDTTYYVRVRAYYTDSEGKSFNGLWSETRAVKTR